MHAITLEHVPADLVSPAVSLAAAIPRFSTARNLERETRGCDVEAASLLISRTPFMEWQRHVCDVANEIDPATGLLWYETVILVVPRQQGKTTLLEPELIAAALRRPDIDVIYTAQDRQMSKRRLIDELGDKRLARRRELQGQFKIRRSNGSESITFGNGSRISTVANTDEAGHGLTLDLAVLDEAFSHNDLTVVTALEPTTITRPDPQLWIVSTVGDGTDGLLQHYQEIGEISLTDPATRVAFFEWSAGDDDDRDDPDTWARCMPAMGYTIDADRIRRRRAELPADVFDRVYLCRRPSLAMVAKISPERWRAAGPGDDTGPLMPTGPYVLALDVLADRSAVTVAVAGRAPGGAVGVVCHTLTGSSVTLPAAVLELYRSLPSPVDVVADRRAGAGSLIDALIRLGLPVRELGALEVVTYAGTMFDLIEGLELRHDGQAGLDAAAGSAVTRPLGDAWAWDRRRSPVETSPLIAATNAAGAHRAVYGAIPTSGRIY